MKEKKIKVKWYVFLIWLILFWPAAIIYVIMVNSERRHQETLKAMKK